MWFFWTSVRPLGDTPVQKRILKIPAPLACYWLGQSELLSKRRKGEED
jgi:hypothetical protein